WEGRDAPANGGRAGLGRVESPADPDKLLLDYRKPDNLKELSKRVVFTLPVAVAVSEGGVPRIPGHEGLENQETPRMVVFGDASWASNRYVNSRKAHADLFLSCLAWLRKKPDVGPPPAEKGKRRKVFTLNEVIKPGTDEAFRLRWLPLVFVCLSIVGLGGAVWITRRR